MDPVSLGVMAVAGGGLSAFGAYQSGQAQAGQQDYQAGMAQFQKKIALQNRDYTLATGETEAANYGLRARNTMGKIVASQGASGIDVGGGSSKAVQAGQQFIADRDLVQIRNNSARKAYGYEVEAATDEAQSGAYSAAASNTRSAIPINVASSFLSSATSVASKWTQGQSAGLWGGGGSGASSIEYS